MPKEALYLYIYKMLAGYALPLKKLPSPLEKIAYAKKMAFSLGKNAFFL